MSAVSVPNVGADLIRIHKVITRGLIVAIQFSQSSGPPPEQSRGFKLYLRALVSLLHAHHLGEDEVAFPFWKDKLPQGPFAALEEQHKQMTPLLTKVEVWLESDPPWDAAQLANLNNIMQALSEIWQPHIKLEEDSLGPKAAELLLSTEENVQLGMQLSAHGQEHAQPSEIVMPFVLYNMTPEDRAIMEQILPPVVSQELVPVTWKQAWAPMAPYLLL